MGQKVKFKVGQAVRVKDGYREEETGQALGGWVGRVVELNAEDRILCMALDSITLRSLPEGYVDNSEVEGLDWTSYYLGYDDVEQTKVRDTERDVETAIKELAAQAGWAYLGAEGQAINQVLGGIDIDDDMAQMEAWRGYFEKSLTFPFTAVVDEVQGRGSRLRAGDQVRVLGIDDVDDLYGVLVRVKRRSGWFVFPLCDLKAVDKGSPNSEPVYLYALWFANR